MMGRQYLTYAILLTITLVASAPGRAPGQTLATYDDFAAPGIDKHRWRGFEHVTAYTRAETLAGGWQNWVEDEATSDPTLSVANERAVREVVSGALRLALTSHGAASASGIVPGVGRLGMRMRHADPAIARLQARVTVAAATVDACGTEGGRARAQVLAHFFNDGSGDVFASLSLERHTFAGDRVVAVVSRCRGASCRTAEDLAFVVFGRAWTPGVAHVLTITHQPDRNRFVFTVSGGGQTAETRALAYPAVTSPQAPELPIRDLRVENAPAFCQPSTGGITRAGITMDARFDTVRIAASEGS